VAIRHGEGVFQNHFRPGKFCGRILQLFNRRLKAGHFAGVTVAKTAGRKVKLHFGDFLSGKGVPDGLRLRIGNRWQLLADPGLQFRQSGRVFSCQCLAGIRQFDLGLVQSGTLFAQFLWRRFDRQDRGLLAGGIHRHRMEHQTGGQGEPAGRDGGLEKSTPGGGGG
jgi:hypothetical protein